MNFVADWDDCERKFVDETKPQDGARWVGTQSKRRPLTRLTMVDFTYGQWKNMEFTDPPYNVEEDLWDTYDRSILVRIGDAMARCLRQEGCVDGTELGCNSGGWYLVSSIMEAIETSDAQWASSVRNAILELGPYMEEEYKAIVVFQSLFPQRAN